MDNHQQVKHLRGARFANKAEALAAVPQWLKDASTRRHSSMDALMREDCYECEPAILYSAGCYVYAWTIRTRSEEVRRDVWQDYTEVWVGGYDHALSYQFAGGIRAALEDGTLQLSPDMVAEIAQVSTTEG